MTCRCKQYLLISFFVFDFNAAALAATTNFVEADCRSLEVTYDGFFARNYQYSQVMLASEDLFESLCLLLLLSSKVNSVSGIDQMVGSSDSLFPISVVKTVITTIMIIAAAGKTIDQIATATVEDFSYMAFLNWQ